MGNCFRNNKAPTQKEVHNPPRAREVEALCARMKNLTPSKLEAKRHFDCCTSTTSKKMMRFRVSHVEPKARGLRIKVVVTQQELKQILNYENDFKYLVTAMKLRGRRIQEVRTNDEDEGIHSKWRPALESVPEDRTSTSWM